MTPEICLAGKCASAGSMQGRFFPVCCSPSHTPRHHQRQAGQQRCWQGTVFFAEEVNSKASTLHSALTGFPSEQHPVCHTHLHHHVPWGPRKWHHGTRAHQTGPGTDQHHPLPASS
eukprot:EG_transcript_24433